MSDIKDFLNTYRKVTTEQLVEVTDGNLMALAEALHGTISFVDGKPRVTVGEGIREKRFSVGDLIDHKGTKKFDLDGWHPAETGDTINGEDLR